MAVSDEPMVRVPVYVTHGRMRLTGYFRHQLDDYHGGEKVVVQSDRGVELGEITVSHCAVCPAKGGCSKPRNVGRRDGEGSPVGRVLRKAGPEDLAESERLAKLDREARDAVRKKVAERGLPMKIVDAERLLGGDRLVLYFSSEVRIDFRELVKELARDFQTRIEMRQIGARDEAKLLGEGYGRCGEVLCCQSFLKDLKNVPMKMAKTQKATLDPNKVSGRCGRLMCCLRYEDDTYEELKKRLPQRGTRVKTPKGEGYVLDAQILTQLVLVDLGDGKGRVAFAIEELNGEPGAAVPADAAEREDAGEGAAGGMSAGVRGEEATDEDGGFGTGIDDKGGDAEKSGEPAGPVRADDRNRPRGPRDRPRGERPPRPRESAPADRDRPGADRPTADAPADGPADSPSNGPTDAPTDASAAASAATTGTGAEPATESPQPGGPAQGPQPADPGGRPERGPGDRAGRGDRKPGGRGGPGRHGGGRGDRNSGRGDGGGQGDRGDRGGRGGRDDDLKAPPTGSFRSAPPRSAPPKPPPPSEESGVFGQGIPQDAAAPAPPPATPAAPPVESVPPSPSPSPAQPQTAAPAPELSAPPAPEAKAEPPAA